MIHQFGTRRIARHNVGSVVFGGELHEMNHPVESTHETLGQFRSYLYLLARAHLGPRVQARIEASDLVQQRDAIELHHLHGLTRAATQHGNSAAMWCYTSDDWYEDGKLDHSEQMHRTISSVAINVTTLKHGIKRFVL